MDNSKNNYIILFEKKQHKILGRVERDKATLRDILYRPVSTAEFLIVS